MKTSELTGALLDYWVARAEGWTFKSSGIGDKLIYATGERPTEWLWLDMFRPSSSWSQGGPIIEREKISLDPVAEQAAIRIPNTAKWRVAYGPPLVAAMRVYVASKFGDEVEDTTDTKEKANG